MDWLIIPAFLVVSPIAWLLLHEGWEASKDEKGTFRWSRLFLILLRLVYIAGIVVLIYFLIQGFLDASPEEFSPGENFPY